MKIRVGVNQSGATVYVILINQEDGTVWNGTALETKAAGNWATYDVAVTEFGSSKIYEADVPTALPAGKYDVFAYIQAGGTPASTDDLGGSAVLEYPGEGGSGQIKLSIGLTEPINFAFTGSSSGTLTATWSAPPQLTPAPTNYSMQVSTNQNFTPTVVTTDTVGLTATGGGLLVNRVYYGRVRATTNGFDPSFYSGVRSTATLAVTPVTVASTWTMVGLSSVTVDWAAGDNPENTQYVCHLSTVSGFGSGTTLSSTTLNTLATFTGLAQATTYYARVKAVNHSGIDTTYLVFGSTVTQELSTFFEDTFTDTNGVNLTAHTSDSGHGWTMGTLAQYPGYDGDGEVQSNTAVVEAGNPLAYTNATPASADYSVTITMVSGTSYGCGPAGRVDASAGDGYFVYWEDGGALRWTLNKFDGSTETVLDNTYTGDDPGAGNKVIKLEMIGSAIKVYFDGVERISVTDSAISAAGVPGMVFSDASEACDNMSAINE